jgi:hypothetical protein
MFMWIGVSFRIWFIILLYEVQMTLDMTRSITFIWLLEHVWFIYVVVHKHNGNHKMIINLLIFCPTSLLALWITFQWITYD